MRKRIVTLDVRDDIRNGREPFGKIMQTVSRLKEDEQLLLIAPFEPAPLFAVLGQQGFSYASKPTSAGDYEVLFTRGARAPADSHSPPAASTPAHSSQARSCSGPPVVEVDARGLEPPQPLVKILEAVARLPRGAQLRARTDRRPMHLYDQLKARGFVGDTEEQPDGSFVTRIRGR